MRTKLFKIAQAATLGFALAFTFSCSSGGGKEETYYSESGSISVRSLELINSTPDITAQQALIYVNQYPVVPDKYKSAQSGMSRAEIEEGLDGLSHIPGFSKEQFLRMLDTDAVFQQFIDVDGYYLYLYVEKE